MRPPSPPVVPRPTHPAALATRLGRTDVASQALARNPAELQVLDSIKNILRTSRSTDDRVRGCTHSESARAREPGRPTAGTRPRARRTVLTARSLAHSPGFGLPIANAGLLQHPSRDCAGARADRRVRRPRGRRQGEWARERRRTFDSPLQPLPARNPLGPPSAARCPAFPSTLTVATVAMFTSGSSSSARS